MSKSAASVANRTHEHSASSTDYVPETPFLIDQALEAAPALLGIAAELESGLIESPFLAEYIGDHEVESPETALFHELVSEVFDEGFDDAVDNLVGDLSGVYEQRFANEAPTLEGRIAAERQLEVYMEPLHQEAMTMLERMATGTEGVEIDGMSDDELEALLNQFEPMVDLPSPAMEEFLGKLYKKAKKAVKKVARKARRVAKTVARVAGKILPHNILLRRLRGLVKPLLRRVLKFAINKIPRRYRPLARQLSRKYLKIARETGLAGEEFTFLEQRLVQGEGQLQDAEAASPDTSVIQAEFDTFLVAQLLNGEHFESTPEFLAYVSDEDDADDDVVGELEVARERFVRELSGLEDGQDPTPQVEEFVAAILPALRIGIKVVGRKRVVNFLAKLVARLIRRYVGRQTAKPLSRALVDAGLKLISLEAPEGEAEVASAELLAATVEEAMERLVAETPVEAFEDEAILESYANDAFEGAVAANFPSTLVRQNLREGRSGAWLMAPHRGMRRYKRYTRVFDVTITPSVAKRVQSFGGQPLAGLLGEQLGLPIDREPVEARLHVYEAIRGTRLSHIARSEGRGTGATASGRGSTLVIHPLTCATAGILIPGESGLSRDVAPRFLANRRHIKVGQRFYTLEIPGAKLLASSASSTPSRKSQSPVRASELNLIIDLRRRRLVVRNFLSESSAQGIAERLRLGAGFSAVSRLLRASLAPGVKAAFSGKPTRHLALIRETGMERRLPSAITGILRMGGDELGTLVMRSLQFELTKLLKFNFESFSKDFLRATEVDADGVTLVSTVEAGALFKLFSTPLAELPSSLSALARQQIVDSIELNVKAGYTS